MSDPFNLENIIDLFTKTSYLNRRSTVPNLSPQLECHDYTHFMTIVTCVSKNDSSKGCSCLGSLGGKTINEIDPICCPIAQGAKASTGYISGPGPFPMKILS
jgi:hypothetical protein